MGNSEQRRAVGGLGCQSITAARGGRAGGVGRARPGSVRYTPAARGVWPVPRRHVPAPQDVTGAGTRGGRGHVGWLAAGLPVRACSAAGRERRGSGAQAAGPAPPRGPRKKDGARSLARGGPAVSERRRPGGYGYGPSPRFLRRPFLFITTSVELIYVLETQSDSECKSNTSTFCTDIGFGQDVYKMQ
jgi:hypothetical protein